MEPNTQYTMPLRWRPVEPGRWFAPPSRAHESDVGYDLATSEGIHIPPGVEVLVPTNIAFQFPPGVWGLLAGRSSAGGRGLAVAQGIIDPGYTGPIFARVVNFTDRKVVVHRGDRIIQMVLHQAYTPPMLRVDEFDATDRGSAGFGSSGR